MWVCICLLSIFCLIVLLLLSGKWNVSREVGCFNYFPCQAFLDFLRFLSSLLWLWLMLMSPFLLTFTPSFLFGVIQRLLPLLLPVLSSSLPILFSSLLKWIRVLLSSSELSMLLLLLLPSLLKVGWAEISSSFSDGQLVVIEAMNLPSLFLTNVIIWPTGKSASSFMSFAIALKLLLHNTNDFVILLAGKWTQTQWAKHHKKGKTN